MSSTTAPPPTINALHSSHRARLLKSTRKLTNLLGATPQVVEPSSAATRNAAESHGRSSHNKLTRNNSKHKPMHLPRPLVLHLNDVSSRIEHAADSTQVITLTPPPPPPAAIATPSPLSSLFRSSEDESMQVSPEKIRRRRMAKLTRTLGENIPTEFILPHDRIKFSHHQRSPSEPAPHSSWPDWGSEVSNNNNNTNNNTTLSSPPTINSLDPSQRARLVKSTRKLENLLGTTPQVVESASAVSSPTRRNSTLVTFPVSSTEPVRHTSLPGHAEKHGRNKSMHVPRPLIIRRHNTVSAVTRLNVSIEQQPSSSSTDPAAQVTLPPTPSPLFDKEDEPMSPMDIPEEKIRRKRMAKKLTRTLGENIPTEFILRRDHHKLAHQHQHQRSPSEPSPRSLWPDWDREQDKNNNRPTTTNTISARSKPAADIQRRRRPASVGSAIAFSPKLFTFTSGPSSSSILSLDSETTEEMDYVSLVGSDWRGEWNIKDAQERAMALRNLRSE